MNLVFAGTPDFAVASLRALIDHRHNVLFVYSQPDRPAGRGRRLRASPVTQFARSRSLRVYHPGTLKTEIDRLTQQAPDAIIVVAYGLILPAEILKIPKFGCINVHASLLPRWRGAAPIQRAIEAGDTRTGVTIMQMATGLDTGDILMQAEILISDDDTSETLHDKLASLGAKTLVSALDKLQAGSLEPRQQEEEGVCYAHKLKKIEGDIEWNQAAVSIEHKIRAYHPWPGVHCQWQEKRLRILATQVDDMTIPPGTAPGTILNTEEGIVVATGQGCLTLVRLQLEGGRAQTAKEFINGHPLKLGDHF